MGEVVVYFKDRDEFKFKYYMRGELVYYLGFATSRAYYKEMFRCLPGMKDTLITLGVIDKNDEITNIKIKENVWKDYM